MSTDTTTKPATPRRTTAMQAFSSLFRTPTRLCTPTTVSGRNKRTRGRPSSLSETSSTPSTPSLPAVVLQTYSLSTDSIVLTSLPSVPFCCHEDLLTMSRAQLEDVIRTLNAQLPCRMRIGPEDDFWQNDDKNRTGDSDGDDGLSRMSETEMKRRIEELVGIRAVVGKNRVPRSGLGLGRHAGVPPAPKAVRTRDVAWRPYEKTPWDMEVDAGVDQSDDSNIMIEDAFTGSSPLASRTKYGGYPRGRNSTFPRLAILQEENEICESEEDDAEGNETRPSKRQRVSSESIGNRPEGDFLIIQEGGESRLVENMDISGSPLLAGEDNVSSVNVAESGERAVTATINSDDSVTKPKEDVQVPLERRRSARVREIALKRASSVNADKTMLETKDLKPSILRSKTFSSRRQSKESSTMTGESNARSDSGAPREFTIRLPFASTPPHQKHDASTWSAPRILRSHSQRLVESSKSTKTKASLGRSQSERYPRAADLAFVTIDRPRYRFARRHSKTTKITKGDHGFHPSTSTSPAHSACQPQQGIQTDDSNAKQASEKENEDPEVANGYPATGGLRTLPTTLRSFLTPRSRAPSTSTVGSTQATGPDSPARTTVRLVDVSTDFVVSDGATEGVSQALGRMAVDSL